MLLKKKKDASFKELYLSFFTAIDQEINFIRIQCIGSYTEEKKWKQISWNNISSHFHAVYSDILYFILFYFILEMLVLTHKIYFITH